MERINAHGMSHAAGAALLIKRYGRGAWRIASNRYDAAETETTASFYDHVLGEIDKQQEASALRNALHKDNA